MGTQRWSIDSIGGPTEGDGELNRGSEWEGVSCQSWEFVAKRMKRLWRTKESFISTLALRLTGIAWRSLIADQQVTGTAYPKRRFSRPEVLYRPLQHLAGSWAKQRLLGSAMFNPSSYQVASVNKRSNIANKIAVPFTHCITHPLRRLEALLAWCQRGSQQKRRSGDGTTKLLGVEGSLCCKRSECNQILKTCPFKLRNSKTFPMKW